MVKLPVIGVPYGGKNNQSAPTFWGNTLLFFLFTIRFQLFPHYTRFFICIHSEQPLKEEQICGFESGALEQLDYHNRVVPEEQNEREALGDSVRECSHPIATL